MCAISPRPIYHAPTRVTPGLTASLRLDSVGGGVRDTGFAGWCRKCKECRNRFSTTIVEFRVVDPVTGTLGLACFNERTLLFPTDCRQFHLLPSSLVSLVLDAVSLVAEFQSTAELQKHYLTFERGLSLCNCRCGCSHNGGSSGCAQSTTSPQIANFPDLTVATVASRNLD
jgi:hypothetical protein